MIHSNKTNRQPTVFIVDDHPLVREGLALLINKLCCYAVVGGAGDVRQALAGIDRTKPDLAIVDIGLKTEDGLELTKSIRKLHPKTKVLILSMYNEGIYAERALRAGARGYIMKNADNEELVKAIRNVLGGKIYLNDSFSSFLLERVVGCQDDYVRTAILTDRETEVLRFIGQGKKNQEIADDMGVSSKTVQAYKEHIKRKLNLKNSGELVHYAIDWAK